MGLLLCCEGEIKGERKHLRPRLRAFFVVVLHKIRFRRNERLIFFVAIFSLFHVVLLRQDTRLTRAPIHTEIVASIPDDDIKTIRGVKFHPPVPVHYGKKWKQAKHARTTHINKSTLISLLKVQTHFVLKYIIKKTKFVYHKKNALHNSFSTYNVIF